jgi:lipoprotein-anchoring transpeptidase ErfK/SrfK
MARCKSGRVGLAIAWLVAGLTLGLGLMAPGPSGSAAAREVVPFADPTVAPGTIVVRTAERRLYLVTAPGQALRYRIAVGRAGKQWQGEKIIEEMQVAPAWSPPASVRRDLPHLPDVIRGGAPNNPMGAAALGLGPGGDYAIHGTNRPDSVGRAASYGCFRMHNADVLDLYARVRLGPRVIVRP